MSDTQETKALTRMIDEKLNFILKINVVTKNKD